MVLVCKLSASFLGSCSWTPEGTELTLTATLTQTLTPDLFITWADSNLFIELLDVVFALEDSKLFWDTSLVIVQVRQYDPVLVCQLHGTSC